MQVEPQNSYQLAIIGGGAAGLSAGLYAGRYGLKTVLFEGPLPGGQTTTAALIENYPGILKIDGAALVQTMRQQAVAAGANLVASTITTVDRGSDELFQLTDEQGRISLAKTLIIASGTVRRHLGLANEAALVGKGVSYCATCDGPLFKNKSVAIVGGGDAAVKSAIDLAGLINRLYLIYREPQLQAEAINLEALKQRPNIEYLAENQVTELIGQERLRGVKLNRIPQNWPSNILELDGLFIEIGADPNLEPYAKLGLSLDSAGRIEVTKAMATSVPGVFAAGDIANGSLDFWQDITAAAGGATAATAAWHYLNQHAHRCQHGFSLRKTS